MGMTDLGINEILGEVHLTTEVGVTFYSIGELATMRTSSAIRFCFCCCLSADRCIFAKFDNDQMLAAGI